MPAYKDAKTGTWYAKFNYKDEKGESKTKFKRGFKRKRDALDFEAEFKTLYSGSPEMSFRSFYTLYKKDVSPRIKESTKEKRQCQMRKIMPYFGKMPLSEIRPRDIRNWQNSLIKKGYSNSYLLSLHSCLSAIFKHAEKFYNLAKNPCTLAGRPKGQQAERDMQIWTLDDFKLAKSSITDPCDRAGLSLLYWTGIRYGELRALTWKDIEGAEDFSLLKWPVLQKTRRQYALYVSKSMRRLKGESIVSSTKTDLVRSVIMPKELIYDLIVYKESLSRFSLEAPVFPYKRVFIENIIKKAHRETGVKRIRVHDLRHSHASLLINMNANIAVISKRLGHKKISTTLDVYSHIFPDEEGKVISLVNKVNQSLRQA